LTKARVVPDLTPDGKSDGFRIVSISPASFYERIGLRNGDVIQRINGIEVKDPQSFMQVFTQLKDETNITMDLMRNNQKESFSYEIR
jgi:general secretion pathway protein C